MCSTGNLGSCIKRRQWLTTLLIGSFSSCGGIPHATSPEHKALRAVYSVGEAERLFKAKFGRYADFDELVRHGLLRRDSARLPMDNYELRLTVSQDRYEAVATPTERCPGSERAFYVDQTGIIRQNAEGPANSSSPEVR